MKYGSKEKWFKFLLYAVAMVLINLVSATLFFRLDLTENKRYSLSEASGDLVSRLEEPLTVRVFLSENLPQPYNNLEQQIRDLMEEYSLAGNRNFNYSLYLLDQEGTAGDKSGHNLRAMAEDYGIPSIQIQNVEKDEVKLQNAYMGMVLVQGDLVETIPALASETNLEYRITTMINKISRKTSTLLGMEDKVTVELLLSPELTELSPDLKNYAGNLKDLVGDLNKRNYGRLEFRSGDLVSYTAEDLKSFGLSRIGLQARNDSENLTAYAGVVVRYHEESRGINLLSKGLFGYSVDPPSDLEKPLEGIVEKLIGLNQSIGYLSDHGTTPLYNNPYAQQQQTTTASNFYRLMSGNYNVQLITLDKIPEDVKTLIINGPKESFSEWELFQLDQFIMNGGSIALFMDSHREIMPSQQQMMYGQTPQYESLHLGLEKLLSHYGVTVAPSYVMDETCFVQQSRDANGGVREIPIYFAPEIPREGISKDKPFMNNINGLITLNISPVEISQTEGDGPESTVLFRSSESSWTVSENINLYNPTTVFPPTDQERASRDLGVLLEGHFTSYFTGKDLPDPPEQEETEGSQAVTIKAEGVALDKGFVSSADAGQLFLVGTSTLLSDNLLEAQGTSPNATMIQNVIDHLNGRDDYAVMRSKGQGYNPLPEVDSKVKAFLKGLNIGFLPVLVILTGIIMWFRWNARKRKIIQLYQ